MFALGKKRHHSQSHIERGNEASDPAFSPTPWSLMSSGCDEDSNFSPSFTRYESEVGKSHRKPPPPPSPSGSYYLSPLRKAMKMSGVLEQPLSEVASDDNVAYSQLDFTRRNVRPLTDPSTFRSKEPSGLTKLLNSPAPPIMNPFSEAVRLTMLKSSRGDVGLKITVYFPHAESPAGESIVLNLHEEASIEELIAMALWTYWENGWIPQLSINHTDSYISRRSVTSSWDVYPVRYGFVDHENGAYGSSDKVRLLDGVVEFAVLKASEDDYRWAKPPGHRKSYSLPSHRMSLLHIHSRRKDHGRRNDPFMSVLVRNDTGGSTDFVEAPKYSEVQDVTRKACKMFNLSYTEDMVLMAVDVQKMLREVPPASRLSTYPDDVEFLLVSRKTSVLGSL